MSSQERTERNSFTKKEPWRTISNTTITNIEIIDFGNKRSAPEQITRKKARIGETISSLHVENDIVQKILNYLSRNRMCGWVKYFYKAYSKELGITPEKLLLALDYLLKSKKVTRTLFLKWNPCECTVIFSLTNHEYPTPQPCAREKGHVIMDPDETLLNKIVRETEIQIAKQELRSSLGRGFLRNFYRRPRSEIDYF
jgi:hypothetical protein